MEQHLQEGQLQEVQLAVGIANGKARYAQQPVAKRFIEAGSEAVVCHLRVADLGKLS